MYPDTVQQACPLTIRLLTNHPRLGHTVLRTLASCGPFYLAKLSSSTSPKSIAASLDSAPLTNREAELLVK